MTRPLVESANHTRYRSGQRTGHYESFFQRANHPTRPQAFWIRYTIFSPQGHPENAIGELWAIYFDAETNRHVAVKSEIPLRECEFARDRFVVRVGDSRLEPGVLAGEAGGEGGSVAWDLTYEGGAEPLLLLPPALYDRGLPKAKSLVGVPMARYSGFLFVDDEAIDIVDWVGSQNHNWGSRHTDEYAWGQVAGFDSHPESFLELATARVKLGPFWTPFLTPLVLRHGGEEHRLNSLRQAWRTRARFDFFHWDVHAENDEVRVEARIEAPRELFVGLRYANPPGGEKHCLNTKLARCDLRFTDKRSGQSTDLRSAHGAAFEILTDRRDHGLAISA